MNLGHQTATLELLPSLNPFQGLTHEDIDEQVLEVLDDKLDDATQLFRNADSETLANTLDVSVQNVEYAKEGVEQARQAVDDARVELNC
jgi:hypothetical protein